MITVTWWYSDIWQGKSLLPVLSHISLAYSFSQALILTYKSYYHFPSFPHKWGTLIGMALKIILTRVINKFVIGSLIIQKHTFWLRLLLHHLIRLSDIVFFILIYCLSHFIYSCILDFSVLQINFFMYNKKNVNNFVDSSYIQLPYHILLIIMVV